MRARYYTRSPMHKSSRSPCKRLRMHAYFLQYYRAPASKRKNSSTTSRSFLYSFGRQSNLHQVSLTIFVMQRTRIKWRITKSRSLKALMVRYQHPGLTAEVGTWNKQRGYNDCVNKAGWLLSVFSISVPQFRQQNEKKFTAHIVIAVNSWPYPVGRSCHRVTT